MVKNLFKFNTTTVKQGSFIHLIIAQMFFFYPVLNKNATYERVLAIKKLVRIIDMM